MLLALLFACTDTTQTEFPTCTVELLSIEPAAAQPGELVTLTADPLTELQDTDLRVGGVDAQVQSVDRTGCDDCDDCRTTQGCAACGDDCDACDAECRDNCVETLSFVVPELSAGTHQVVLFNAHGGSLAAPFEVLETAVDTGPVDSGDSGR